MLTEGKKYALGAMDMKRELKGLTLGEMDVGWVG